VLLATLVHAQTAPMYGLQVKQMLGLLKDLSSCADIGFNPLLGFYSLMKKEHLNLPVFT